MEITIKIYLDMDITTGTLSPFTKICACAKGLCKVFRNLRLLKSAQFVEITIATHKCWKKKKHRTRDYTFCILRDWATFNKSLKKHIILCENTDIFVSFLFSLQLSSCILYHVSILHCFLYIFSLSQQFFLLYLLASTQVGDVLTHLPGYMPSYCLLHIPSLLEPMYEAWCDRLWESSGLKTVLWETSWNWTR